MTQLSGATCGLLVFSAMIVCGLLAGNSAAVILLRATGGLFGGLLLGMWAGWVGTLVVRENVDVAGDQSAEEENTDGPTDAPQPS